MKRNEILDKKERPQDFKKTVKSLFKYYRVFIPLLIAAMVIGVISTGLSLITPYKTSDLIDTISVGLTGLMDLNAVVEICTFLLVLHLISILLGYIQHLFMVEISQRLSRNLRTEINKKIHKIKLKYFDDNNFGDLLSRLVNDVELVSNNLSNNLTHLVASILMLIGSGLMMLIINWKMGSVAMLFSIMGFFFISLIVKKSQKYFVAQRENEGKLNGYIEETYAGHKIVKSYNNEDHVKAEFNKVNEAVYQSDWISAALSSLTQPITTLIGSISYVVICVMGAMMVANGTITFGTIVSFIIFIKLFIQPLSSISQIITTLQSTLAAAERVFGFLDNEDLSPEAENLKSLSNINGDVEFENVSFGYKEDKTIIKNLSVSLKAGQKVAIVGATGAGKTTLVNLLMRFYEVNSGDIKIDGVSIKEISRKNLHDLFGMVLQDTWIFEGTIRENLIYTTPDITDEKLDRVCTELGLKNWIESLPAGYDTVLTEQTTFSGGQQQLLTIARAMLKNAPLLILDEATSSIDTRTEQVVQSAMDKLMHGRTSFVIAHRLSTIKNADIILVIKDGDVVEKGNHDTLLSMDGLYAKMYNAQFK